MKITSSLFVFFWLLTNGFYEFPFSSFLKNFMFKVSVFLSVFDAIALWKKIVLNKNLKLIYKNISKNTSIFIKDLHSFDPNLGFFNFIGVIIVRFFSFSILFLIQNLKVLFSKFNELTKEDKLQLIFLEILTCIFILPIPLFYYVSFCLFFLIQLIIHLLCLLFVSFYEYFILKYLKYFVSKKNTMRQKTKIKLHYFAITSFLDKFFLNFYDEFFNQPSFEFLLDLIAVWFYYTCGIFVSSLFKLFARFLIRFFPTAVARTKKFIKFITRVEDGFWDRLDLIIDSIEKYRTDSLYRKYLKNSIKIKIKEYAKKIIINSFLKFFYFLKKTSYALIIIFWKFIKMTLVISYVLIAIIFSCLKVLIICFILMIIWPIEQFLYNCFKFLYFILLIFRSILYSITYLFEMILSFLLTFYKHNLSDDVIKPLNFFLNNLVSFISIKLLIKSFYDSFTYFNNVCFIRFYLKDWENLKDKDKCYVKIGFWLFLIILLIILIYNYDQLVWLYHLFDIPQPKARYKSEKDKEMDMDDNFVGGVAIAIYIVAVIIVYWFAE